MIDIGGGTTDYVLYVDGAMKQSGALPFGGDNITKIIALRLQISNEEAETLKIKRRAFEGGDALTNRAPLFANGPRDQQLDMMIHLQFKEVFAGLQKQISPLPQQVLLTGGCSLAKHSTQMASAVFRFKHTGNANNALAVGRPFGAPQCSTALGLVTCGARQS